MRKTKKFIQKGGYLLSAVTSQGVKLENPFKVNLLIHQDRVNLPRISVTKMKFRAK